ncbi:MULTISPECIES: (2E,6E)-farnesyl diphosphate synthase [unclassified Shewanella]|uniref:(2E,6E)-farnesyl diphosphate synthase n=1 Tax=unclassified Shewanella TaxID=196818 RepID=UPI000C864A9F|nr:MULTISPECIES: (2E,6E)-farnesyl diphosphate synthase [unclassified Shewanella]MDO6641153.1 (2E,6E)-farnesyl diphosphate synthase [Shewanella sp. 5_MG-2023]MDO6678565.1 (2E,6E)-farnesyl diphosphate synthase [Shewanella sp. 4_MG-2023]MDO6774693.1 (2E,6E)-farnesyl diphosphate synthase [Shewanella sp. 3_MG-2023]PMG31987.1 geranyl transferase [Shewanella sp. 10N.286.52.C2]PMG49870.1 geranyl transferase [Shewanella sp. 10N.286.52.B9]
MLAQSIEQYQQRVNQVLATKLAQLDDAAPILKAAMTHGALLGGKRIRPFMVYSIGEMLGADLKQLDNAAAAIECIHAYSLIHDDLPAMDDDALRRGQPTVHIAFDEASAILAGDALQTLAFELICEPNESISASQQLAMVTALAKASGYSGMCGGQAIDLGATNKRIDLEQLTLLHNKKTGALISCAAELALIAASASSLDQQIIRDFAANIGLAFQVQDDILDIIASTEELGKPQGSDQESNKSTFPKLLGLKGANECAEQLINDALSALAKLTYNSQLIADFARYIIARRI